MDPRVGVALTACECGEFVVSSRATPCPLEYLSTT
jgi:hypothetical protein